MRCGKLCGWLWWLLFVRAMDITTTGSTRDTIETSEWYIIKGIGRRRMLLLLLIVLLLWNHGRTTRTTTTTTRH
jgi:hypothetical protein